METYDDPAWMRSTDVNPNSNALKAKYYSGSDFYRLENIKRLKIMIVYLFIQFYYSLLLWFVKCLKCFMQFM